MSSPIAQAAFTTILFSGSYLLAGVPILYLYHRLHIRYQTCRVAEALPDARNESVDLFATRRSVWILFFIVWFILSLLAFLFLAFLPPFKYN